jgi:iron complex transport system ATP-binding protein
MKSARLVGRDLTVDYGPARALDRATIELAAGELVALIGPNGSGKSTFLRVLLGAQRPSTGEVTLDGLPLAAIPPRTRARTLTMVVHGSPADFAIRVRDLVALGRIPHERRLGGTSADDARAVEEAMAATDTATLAERTIDTLSAGELQRAHLARVFAQRAPVVLLDEPTANLDPRHQLEAMALLRGFVSRGGAAIVALHDLSLAARTCDRIVVLERGRVRADGAPGQVLGETLLADVFGVKARVSRNEAGGIDYVLPLAPLSADSLSSKTDSNESNKEGSLP